MSAPPQDAASRLEPFTITTEQGERITYHPVGDEGYWVATQEGMPDLWGLSRVASRAVSQLRAALEDNQEMRSALEEITKREGAFSLDPLTHASNVIDSNVAIAERALSASIASPVHNFDESDTPLEY